MAITMSYLGAVAKSLGRAQAPGLAGALPRAVKLARDGGALAGGDLRVEDGDPLARDPVRDEDLAHPHVHGGGLDEDDVAAVWAGDDPLGARGELGALVDRAREGDRDLFDLARPRVVDVARGDAAIERVL
ncbi:MAG: hypothetical protein IPK80_15940 [Nannocystis sp.]|nr:hypothetical protein [Nannocystis sp.]